MSTRKADIATYRAAHNGEDHQFIDVIRKKCFHCCFSYWWIRLESNIQRQRNHHKTQSFCKYIHGITRFLYQKNNCRDNTTDDSSRLHTPSEEHLKPESSTGNVANIKRKAAQ